MKNQRDPAVTVYSSTNMNCTKQLTNMRSAPSFENKTFESFGLYFAGQEETTFSLLLEQGSLLT